MNQDELVGEEAGAVPELVGYLLKSLGTGKPVTALIQNAPQEDVYHQVVARGYRAGWTPEQFIARQLCKLVEELAELSFSVTFHQGPPVWLELVRIAGKYARQDFDRPDAWENVGVTYRDFREELVDLQVVLFAAAGELDHQKTLGHTYNVVAAAVDKAARDVERGVR